MPYYSSIYERIADEMVKRIESGEFPPGAKLPSRAELCAEYEVSDFVADRVFLTLRMRGLTETVPGRGVYVKESG
jgi:GntR family transcriptional regulator